MRRPLPIRACALALVLAGAPLALAPAGWGRAGGGGGFRTGPAESGGGGDTGGGDAYLIGGLVQMVVRLTFAAPAVMVPLELLGLAVALHLYRRRPTAWRELSEAAGAAAGWQGRGGPAGGAAPGVSRRQASGHSLAALKARDPAFDEAAFGRRVAGAFTAVQQEWSARRLDRVRALTTDGARERFQLLLDLDQLRGIANVTRDVAVTGLQLAEATSDAFFDSLTVRIEASAVDFYVRAGTDELVYGSRQPAPFAEYWTFLRRPGAHTGAGPGLLEGHCPGCGAAMSLTDRGECAYCKAVVHSGAFDWVLSEITQTSVSDGHHRAVSGLAELSARDPAFNVQYVEDRASLLFWRLRAAEMRATAAPLTSLVTADFLTKRRARVEAGAGGVRRFCCDAAVGAVELLAVQPGGAGAQDRLYVRVKWSGREVKAALPGFLPPDLSACTLVDQEYVLVRDAAARTPAEQGLRSAHCLACGAPQAADAGAACASCGTALNSGALDWLLAEIRLFTGVPQDDAGQGPAAERRPRLPEAEQLIAASAMALGGRRMTPAARALLAHFAARRHVSPERLAQLSQAVEAGALPGVQFATAAQKRVFLECLLHACQTDGQLTAAEEELIAALGARLAPDGFDVAGELAALKASLAGAGRPPAA